MKSAILRSSFCLILAACRAECCLSHPLPPKQNPENDGWISLFNGKNFNGWYSYLDPAARTRIRKASSK